jgi:hypothetical protein
MRNDRRRSSPASVQGVEYAQVVVGVDWDLERYLKERRQSPGTSELGEWLVARALGFDWDRQLAATLFLETRNRFISLQLYRVGLCIPTHEISAQTGLVRPE